MANVCPTCGAQAPNIRSFDQLKRYFAVIKAAFHHWPESHPRQFVNETELRKWLQMEAGHKVLKRRAKLAGMSRDYVIATIETAYRDADAFAVVEVENGDVLTWVPKSIAYKNLTHLKFCDLNNEVDAVIERELGVNGERLLDEHRRAA